MKFLKEVTIVLCFLLSTSAFAQWTGKYQLSFDETDPSVFYVEVVPDMDYVGVFEPQSAVAVFADPAVSYDISFPLGSWHQLGPIYSFCDVQLYDFTKQDQTSVTLEAGVPIRIIKFKALDSDCGVGEGVRLYGLYNNQTTGFDPCEILYGQLDPGLVTSGLLPEENSYTLALTGINNDYTNPLTCDDIINDCIEIVGGDAWNESINKEQSYNMTDLTYDPITIEGGTGGMFFDVYRLDNSFDLKVNGQSIATSELQFDTGSDNAQPGAESFNVRFMDGDLYKYDTPSIWQIVGTEENPMLRVEVNANGEVFLYGSKTSGGKLYPLRTYNGVSLKQVNWNATGSNTVELSQDANGWTKLHGKVYGVDLCDDGMLKLTKVANTTVLQDAQVGDIITYTFEVTNLDNEDISDITLIDPLLNTELQNPETGALGAGQTWTYTADYAITAQDIENGGVYNQAVVFGIDHNGNAIPTKKSFDPINGLDENDPNYNATCATCTFTAIVPAGGCERAISIKSADPFYWYFGSGIAPSSVLTNEGSVEGGNAGFVFDIYQLDNSFNMKINDTWLFDQEIQFQANLTQNIRFVDGDRYENEVPHIASLRGNLERPMLRVRVDSNGKVRMFGSKVNYGELYELELIEGEFNTINWQAETTNTILVSQDVRFKTVFDGYGYGIDKICDAITFEKVSTFIDENTNNIAEAGESIKYTFIIENTGSVDLYDVQIFDELLGGYIPSTAFVSGDNNSDGVLNPGEVWVYEANYLITEEDISSGGVYNQAEVYVSRDGVAMLPVKSYDPNNSSLDLDRPDHTFTLLPNDPEDCFANINDGNAVNYRVWGSYLERNVYTYQLAPIGPSNQGYRFDFYKLDNSFNMEINGTTIADHEIEFQQQRTLYGRNIRFIDGDEYQVNTPNIPSIVGTAEHPMLRVEIDEDGEVRMWGRKNNTDETLYELELINGNFFNFINWKTELSEGVNEIKITQILHSWTEIQGQGFALVDRCASDYVPFSYEEPEGIEEFDSLNIKLYPNPVQHTLYIEATSTIEEVSVYNMLGQKVRSERPNGLETRIDMESLQSDTYLIKVVSEGKTETYRVVKR